MNDPNATTAFNTATTIDVLANDTPDPYGPLNPASVTVTSAPANGTTSVNSTTGAITYTPNATFVGTDTFTYQVCSSESSSLCDVAGVTITVGAGPGVAASLTPTAPNTGTGQTPIVPSILLLTAGIVISLTGVRVYMRPRGYKISSRA